MSDIKAGDTVMVAYALPCCGGGARYGFTYTVSQIFVNKNVYCIYCHTTAESIEVAVIDGEANGFATVRLIKLPPLEELESRKEEAHA